MSQTYTRNEFVVDDSDNDIIDNPRVGTLLECQTICDGIDNCIGFSFPKNEDTSTSQQCLLKKKFNSKNTFSNDWVTYSNPKSNNVNIYDLTASYNRIDTAFLDSIYDIPIKSEKGNENDFEKICNSETECI